MVLLAMSPEMEGLVETSSNLARVNIRDGQLVVISSQRSSRDKGLADLTSMIESVGKKERCKFHSQFRLSCVARAGYVLHLY